MPGLSVSEQLSNGQFSTGAVAALLNIPHHQVHSLATRGELKRSVYNPTGVPDPYRKRVHYRYDIDTIVDVALKQFATKNKPITAQLQTAAIRHGSEKSRRRIAELRNANRLRLLFQRSMTGLVTFSGFIKTCTTLFICDIKKLIERAQILSEFSETESDLHNELEKAGLYPKYFVMREDQESLSEGTSTFTFTSENPCYADILAFASFAMSDKMPDAAAAMLALAINHGFNTHDDFDLLHLPIDKVVDAERIKIKKRELKAAALASDKADAQARADKAKERKGMSPGQIAELLRQPSNS